MAESKVKINIVKKGNWTGYPETRFSMKCQRCGCEAVVQRNDGHNENYYTDCPECKYTVICRRLAQPSKFSTFIKNLFSSEAKPSLPIPHNGGEL